MPDADLIAQAVIHSQIKIEWAKNHINGVKDNVEFLTSQQGYTIESQRDPQSGKYFVYIGPKGGQLPAGLPLHMGDAVHSLNSVMDFLWSGLARSFDPGLATKITFPRHEERHNLVNSLADP